jgi:flagellar hook-associated protein 3 FlgL
MRVTDGINFGIVRDSVTKSRSKLGEYQTQSASLKKLNVPSDDPVGSAKLLEIRTQKVNTDQFGTNARLAQSFLENTDSAIGELSEIVGRAKEIAINQASGASSNDSSRLGVAEEITQLYNQAIAVANRRYGDRYIFGGYKTDRSPVDADGNYKGDKGQMMVEIAKGVYLSSNVPGIDVFNTNSQNSSDGRKGYTDNATRRPATMEEGGLPHEGTPLAENVNVFDELQNLRIGLLTGDFDAIRNTLERFDSMQANLISNRTKVGSRLQGMNASISSNERQGLTNAQLASSIEDADMAEVMSNMAKEEAVFKASLQSSQKLIQPTLMDFLK